MLKVHQHGKGRVRLVKVHRGKDKHSVLQYNVKVVVQGDAAKASYVTGDNSNVLPTDTIKNTIYYLAKSSEFSSMEDFGIIVAKYFVTTHSSQMQKAIVTIEEENWTRLSTPSSSKDIVKPHHHAFVVSGSHTNFTTVTATSSSLLVESGVKGLKILKTTQSSFKNFCKDALTTLPDVDDRLVSTVLSSKWKYTNNTISDYNNARKSVITTILNAFAGPSDVGTPSPAVQFTLHQMGKAVLSQNSSNVSEIWFSMPNVHNLPLEPSKHFGIPNIHPHGEIFVPVDEPHGIIEATMVPAKL